MADNIPRHINNIQFGIYSSDEIEKLSVVEIFKPETMENGIPVANGLFDTRMGVTERDDKCLSCEHDGANCNGHFGHINLVVPLFNYLFIKKIKEIINVTCINCSRLIPNIGAQQKVNILGVNKTNRIKKIDALIKSQSLKKCFHCGFIRPTFKIPKGEPRIYYTITDAGSTKEQVLLANHILVIFERMQGDEISLLGMDPRYTHPKDLIRTKLLVAPPCVRPAMKRDDNQRSEDDLTVNYVTIVKENNKLKDKIRANPSAKYNSSYIDELTIIIASMVDSTIKKSLKNPKMISGMSKKQFKSIKDRISAKHGRIRQNLMGKRTNNSARTVITPDPMLRISQIGVPLKIAMNMTYPEIVTNYNKDKLYRLIANGPNKYPGAKSYISGGNKKYERRLDFIGKNATGNETEIVLKNGDIVRRHILDDEDIFMFNRQPSLHKVSMMGHTAKIMHKGDTFRMNVTVCKPYNADFDGDEMNKFLPQTDGTAAELRYIALSNKQIIVPGDNKPIMGLVQDALVGISILTRSKVLLNKYQVMDLVMWIPHFDGQLPEPQVNNKDGQFWTGRQIISMVLPNINTVIHNNDYDPEKTEEYTDTKIIIKNGNIESGVFMKSAVGAGKAGNLVHIIMNDFGGEICDDFLTSLQQIVNQFLVFEGLTMGYSDIVLEDKTKQKIHDIIVEGHQKAQDLIDKVDRGEFIAPLGKSNEEYFEIEMRNNLSYIRDQAGKIANESLSFEENNMKKMVESGSKGSNINIGQITASVGGQDIAGARVDKSMFGSRTIPHCHKYDDTPLYRGFVYNSFLDGLSPEEFFFHAISGREGNIDTAIKSVTGDTAIIITENGKTKRVLIGDWIDNHLDTNSENVEHYTEREMELLKTEFIYDKPNILIPTTDSKGNVTWGEITAITRHLPGKELYKIKTLGGREVIVTESKSLLIWDSDKQEYLRKDTPLVKVGDYVPTTMVLPSHPEPTTHINMSEYLPKSEYIYGTDFMEASKLVFDDYNSRVPQGWWNKNNGSTFTLPYEYTHKLLRVTRRSDISNIKEGYIYPYNSRRNGTFIPDKLELNRENGFFIGLYLAEGDSQIKGGCVRISNNDKVIQEITTKWFEKLSMKWDIKSKINNVGGTSTSIRGFSTVLASFFIKLVGHGARNKHIPVESYSAPDEFIIGLLDGYIAGDGCVTKNSIQVTSASAELIEGISVLCTRLGIFAKVSETAMKTNNVGTIDIAPIHTLSIRGQWATMYANIVGSSHPEKAIKLEQMKCSEIHRNFPEQRDTVLDKITNIELVDIKEYPKVYDLTIPSTLNFGLANGMHVVDTADSGYISRRIMKMMEDIRVWYDCTVRNAGNQIIEFMYGSNGIDPIKEEKQKFETMKMDDAKLSKVYGFVIEELVDLFDNKLKVKLDVTDKKKLSKSELAKKLDEEYERIYEDRNILRYMFKDELNITDTINCSVNVKRIITNCISNFNIDVSKKIKKGTLKCNPIKIIDKVSALCEELQYLFVNVHNKELIDPILMENYNNGTTLMKIMIRTHLASKRVILDYKLSMEHLDYIINTIKVRFVEAIVNPGEMVGPIAAQSVSEPSTQLTLNTFHSTGIGTKSNTITGIPRIKEIINVTRNIKSPSSVMYLKNLETGYLNERNKEIATKLISIKLKDVINVNKTTKFYDPNPVKSILPEDNKIINDYIKYSVDFQLPDTNVTKWVIRLEIDKNELILKQMRMDYIKRKINELIPYGLYIICSDDNAQQLVIRIHLIPNKLPDKNKGDELALIEKYKNKIINETNLRGIDNLTSVDPRKRNKDIFIEETGGYKSVEEYYIDTDGTNLIDLLGSEYLDTTRVITNDIREIADVLGIEAARTALYRELEMVLRGSNVNFHHYNLICDLMSFPGVLTSMDRHGIGKLDNGPLGRASFEETLDQFKDAGFYSYIDPVTGSSSNLMVSQLVRGGTGMPDVYVDEDYYGVAQDDLEDALA